MHPSSLLEPRRILVRGVNWLGDAVMTTPALQRLRERFPRAHITLLTPVKLTERVPVRPGHVSMRKRSRREIEQLIAGTGSAHRPSRITSPESSHQIHDYLYLASVLGASPKPLAPVLEIRDDEVQAAENKWL